jgi:hypothetical protein
MVMMTRQARNALHRKQDRIQVKDGVPVITDLVEGVPVIRSTSEGLVEYIRYGNILYKQVYSKASDSTTINDYTITWSANEPTAGSANTIDDGNTVGDDNEGGQAIADLTAKVNTILSVLRTKKIIT